MRLTCPNCGAQYEIPETAIPAAGRDVQCSACGATWVQHRPEAAGPVEEPDPTPAPDPAETPAAPPDPAPAQRRLDPEVADILRSEAARERAQRAAEATGDVGPRPDPSEGTDDPAPLAAPALHGARRATDDAGPAPSHTASQTASHSASQPGTLPDIEGIGSSLTPTRGRAARDETPEEPLATSIPEAGGGFQAGFWVAMIAVALAVGVYVAAPELVEMVPEAEAPVERYVATIDEARLRLDAILDRIVAQVTGG